MPHSIKEFGTLGDDREFTYDERFDSVKVNTLGDEVFTDIR